MIASLALAAPLTTRAADAPTTRPHPAASRGDDGGPRGGMLVERTRRVLDDLDLTDEQKQKLDAVFQQARDDFQAMRGDLETLAPPERRQKMQDFFQSLRDKVSAELTDSQRQELGQKMEEVRQRLRDAGAAAATQPGVLVDRISDRIQDALKQIDLSDEQKTQVATLMDDTKTRLKAVREKAEAAGEQARHEFRQIVDEARNQLQSILTPEQQEQLKEKMRANANQPDSPRPRRRGAGAGKGG
jgi:Spy/CpxP family protein refolding chaperone